MAKRVNSSGWKRKEARLRGARLNARIDATRTIGAKVARTIVNTGPRDTLRFTRSYAMAHNDLSPTVRITIPSVRESKYAKQNLARIRKQASRAEEQVERWTRNVESYRRRRQLSNPSGRAAQKYLRQWTKQLEQAQAQLESIDAAPDEAGAAIVIGGRKRKRNAAAGAGGPKSSISRVSVKVHGGSGKIIEAGGRLFAEIRSREPHARLVNRRTRVVSRAVQTIRVVGARGAAPAYLDRLRKAAR